MAVECLLQNADLTWQPGCSQSQAGEVQAQQSLMPQCFTVRVARLIVLRPSSQSSSRDRNAALDGRANRFSSRAVGGAVPQSGRTSHPRHQRWELSAAAWRFSQRKDAAKISAAETYEYPGLLMAPHSSSWLLGWLAFFVRQFFNFGVHGYEMRPGTKA